jgi:hypothetical protein
MEIEIDLVGSEIEMEEDLVGSEMEMENDLVGSRFADLLLLNVFLKQSCISPQTPFGFV